MDFLKESTDPANKTIDEIRNNANRLMRASMKAGSIRTQAAQDYQLQYIQYFQDLFDNFIELIKEAYNISVSTRLPFTGAYGRYDNSNQFAKGLIDTWNRSANVLIDTMLSETKLANKLAQATLDSSKNSMQYIKNNANVTLKITSKTCEQVLAKAGVESNATVQKQYVEQSLERYPSARFPKKIVIGDIGGLEVSITAPQTPSPEYVAPSSEQEDIPIEVIVRQEGFEVIGDDHGTILVSTKSQDSKPIVFSLRAKEEGMQNIKIDFWEKGTRLGQLIVNSLVVGSSEQGDSSAVANTVLVNEDWKQPSVNPDPDITIYIYEKNKTTFEYTVRLIGRIGDQRLYSSGPIEFKEEPKQKFLNIFDEIEKTYKTSPEDVEETLRAKGKLLYDELFPKSLKEIYWQISDRIESIRVISEEPWIPWEIMKPWQQVNKTIQEDDFLCQRYAFSRWLERPEEIKKDAIDRVKMVVPADTNLANAIKERDWIKQFGTANSFDVSTCSSYEDIMDAIRKGDFDILHFSTHGKYDQDKPEASPVILEEKRQLKPERLVGQLFGNGSSPLVFLNTCQAAGQGFSLTGIIGWSDAFIQMGASAFIGPLWSVSDDAAYDFSTEFYRQISTGKTGLGEAVRRARNHCRKPNDPSWLAYQFYGHPNSRVKLGTI